MEKQDGRAFVGYSNDTPHYLFRKHTLGGEIHFDIENEGLIYSDSKAYGMHGLQCGLKEENPNYFKVLELCQKVVELVKEIDKLNNEK